MSRKLLDLSHHIHTCGKIGRLQTLGIRQVVAGESIQMNLNGAFRLAPTRKEIVQDARIDIFAFYRPHRHTYGEDWLNFIKTGVDEAVSGATITLTPDGNAIEYAGMPVDSALIPRHTTEGYWDIYNWYFKNPDDGDVSTSKVVADQEERQYGTLIARLPSPYTRPRQVGTLIGQSGDLDDADAEYATAGGIVDVRELSKVSAQYKTEIESNWYAQRYPDLMQDKWGASVTEETDERPTLIWKHSQFVSGYDQDGTDDATLGDIQGKTVARINVDIPRYYCPEHGTIYLLAAVRFPTIHAYEQNPLLDTPYLDYAEIAGDPVIVASQPPRQFEIDRYLRNSSNFSDSQEPYGQHYRWQPNRIHQNYRDIPGYPFLKYDFNTADKCFYHQDGDYDDVFHTWQLGHWQMNLRNTMYLVTQIPDVDASIETGANIGA